MILNWRQRSNLLRVSTTSLQAVVEISFVAPSVYNFITEPAGWDDYYFGGISTVGGDWTREEKLSISSIRALCLFPGQNETAL